MSRLLLAAVAVFHATVALSASRAEIEELAIALGLPDLIEVMRDEGLEHGRDIEQQLFPSRGGAAWMEAVGTIYDPELMKGTVVDTLANDLGHIDVTPLLEFFTSERGRRIVSYEVSARQALTDDDIEAAARARLADLRATDAAELEGIRRFVEANDLIESNVMGAMNSNYAFYQGLAEAGAFDGTMGEREILADVWAQEESIRADTDEWVYSYLAMAYRPLSEGDLEAYIALSETSEGRALNRALFEGFDEMYVAISRSLGLAAAGAMSGEDI